MAVHKTRARHVIVAQQSVHPTSGTLRVFKHFTRLQVFPLPNGVHARPLAGNASRWLPVVKHKIMNKSEKWKYISELDEELLQGGIILSEWSTFLIRDADIAFCNGAYLAAILTAVAGIESHLRFEYQNNKNEKHLGLYELIENSPIDDDLRQELHKLRKFRNQWVHVNEPRDDQKLLESPSQIEKEIETIAKAAIKLLRRAIYLEQWV
jgi:hypothetical protein